MSGRNALGPSCSALFTFTVIFIYILCNVGVGYNVLVLHAKCTLYLFLIHRLSYFDQCCL